MKIRAKMLLVMLPLVVATTSITGIVAATSATAGLTRMGFRLLSFKAEELAGYMRSQWQLLLDNGFAGSPPFVDAAKTNVVSFASSLLRSDSELVVAADPSGNLVLQTADLRLGEDEQLQLAAARPKDSWLEIPIGGARYVGFTFRFVPFDWQVFVLEERGSFLREVRQITTRVTLVLAVAIAVGTGLALAFSLYLTRPLSRVVSAIERIRIDSPAADPITVEYPDEIGQLAHRFNLMTNDLGAAYTRLRDFAFREALARVQITASQRETLAVLARAGERRDPETAAHISRVGLYARLLASGVGLSDEQANLVYFASPLHDIGKLGVPEAVLLKPGDLEPDERELMKRHPTIGYEVLKDARNPYLRAGAVIALTHHERYDGSGYPQGLSRDEIPLYGRIVGLADVFDALTTKRPYKEPWDLETTMTYLKGQRDRLFESRLIAALESSFEEAVRIRSEHPG